MFLKKCCSILCLVLISSFLLGQSKILEKNEVVLLEYFDLSPIQVVKYKTIDPELPLLIYLQGSLPRPLVIKYEEDYHVTVPFSNFDESLILNNYNLLMISHPAIPAVAHIDELNEQAWYVPDLNSPNSIDPEYQKFNNLENLLSRIRFVLHELDINNFPNEIFLLGHSQGSILATHIGAEYAKIKKTALLSFNPYGRYQADTFQIKQAYDKGELSHSEFVSKKNKFLNRINFYRIHLDSIPSYGDAPLTNLSFSTNCLYSLLRISGEILVINGSLSRESTFCDLVEVEFRLKGKDNFNNRVIDQVDHNFFPKLSNGTPDFQNSKWNEVIQTVNQWFSE